MGLFMCFLCVKGDGEREKREWESFCGVWWSDVGLGEMESECERVFLEGFCVGSPCLLVWVCMGFIDMEGGCWREMKLKIGGKSG